MHPSETHIPPEQAGTLAGLFRERVRRTPGDIAYRQFERDTGRWQETTWAAMADEVGRWQAALRTEGLAPGERVAILLRNCRQWVAFDQAALGLGLVVVPLYVEDRPESSAYILEHSGARLLLLPDGRQWRRLSPALDMLPRLRVVLLEGAEQADDPRLRHCREWLPAQTDEPLADLPAGEDLASIVYTSGTTGRPKGVMLSHSNLLSNTEACLRLEPFTAADTFLSFLPLSHTLERTGGYYLPMMAGATVAYARSIQHLADDLQQVRPSVLIAVPRIFEKVYARIQAQLMQHPAWRQALFRATLAVGWRHFLHRQGRGPWHPGLLLWPLLYRLVAARVHARLGGRLRLAVSGGAPLPPAVGRFFVSLGLDLIQGYGLTEASPVVAVNTPRDNIPESAGIPLPGVVLRLGEADELLIRGPGIMQGYWHDPEASAAAIDPEGWLHSGDQARLEGDHVYITGRLKDILVLSNGEKVPPGEMEAAIALDPLFEQVMVLGEGRPYLAALVVLEREAWTELARRLQLAPDDAASLEATALQRHLLGRVRERLGGFPGYAKVRRIAATLEPWTVEDGLLTPTMKLRRKAVQTRHQDQIEQLFKED